MNTTTLQKPLGGEVYLEFEDRFKNKYVLTFNDLYMMIVCRTAFNGDWLRTRQAAAVVQDAPKKRALTERLWELEQTLGGLPEIPGDVVTLHRQRSYHWFKQSPVLTDKRW